MENEQETILRRITKENKETLRISRVPPKTREAFITLANEDFCGDYGMCLKFLMDRIVGPKTQELFEFISEMNETISSHEGRITQLEKTLQCTKPEPSEEVQQIKMLSGKLINKTNRGE